MRPRFILIDPHTAILTRMVVGADSRDVIERARQTQPNLEIYIRLDEAVDFSMMMKEDDPLWQAWLASTMMVPSDVPVPIVPDTSRGQLEFQVMCLASVDQARAQIAAKIEELRGECGIADDPDESTDNES
jgi:hypothetical protein